jgi:hypothetical protein
LTIGVALGIQIGGSRKSGTKSYRRDFFFFEVLFFAAFFFEDFFFGIIFLAVFLTFLTANFVAVFVASAV